MFQTWKNKPAMTLDNCQRVAEIQSLDKLESTTRIFVDGCYNLSDKFKKMLLQVNRFGHITLMLLSPITHTFLCTIHELPSRCIHGTTVPRNQVPDWCNFRSEGSIISFQVPPASNCPIIGLILCAAYSAEENLMILLGFGDIVIKKESKEP